MEPKVICISSGDDPAFLWSDLNEGLAGALSSGYTYPYIFIGVVDGVRMGFFAPESGPTPIHGLIASDRWLKPKESNALLEKELNRLYAEDEASEPDVQTGT